MSPDTTLVRNDFYPGDIDGSYFARKNPAPYQGELEMTDPAASTCTAFAGVKRICSGRLSAVALEAKAINDRGEIDSGADLR